MKPRKWKRYWLVQLVVPALLASSAQAHGGFWRGYSIFLPQCGQIRPPGLPLGAVSHGPAVRTR